MSSRVFGHPEVGDALSANQRQAETSRFPDKVCRHLVPRVHVDNLHL